MKKSLIAISISILLSACGGGSDGGSKEPVNPPKPPVTEETIQSLADSLNVDYSTVETMCIDKSFTCVVESSSAAIYTKDGLIDLYTELDSGYFTNSSIINFKHDAPEIDDDNSNLKGFLQIELIVNGRTNTTVLSDLNVSSVSDSGHLSVYLNEYTDIRKHDLTELYTLLSDSETLSNVNMILTVHNTANGTVVKNLETSLDSEAFKAAFSVLLQKNQELYEGEPEPENTAPQLTFGSLVNDSMLANTVERFSINTWDNEGDQFTVEVTGVSFAEFNHDPSYPSNDVILKPSLSDVGTHTLQFKVTDEHGLTTENSYTFTVAIEATDLEPSEPTELALFAKAIGAEFWEVEPLVTSDRIKPVLENGVPLVYVYNGNGKADRVVNFAENTIKFVIEDFESGLETNDVISRFEIDISDYDLHKFNDPKFNYTFEVTKPDNYLLTATHAITEMSLLAIDKAMYSFYGYYNGGDNYISARTEYLSNEHDYAAEALENLMRKVSVDLELKPEPTLNDLANLIGEPIEKLETLFKSPQLGWTITENNEPVIYINHVVYSVVAFNLANGDMTFLGETWVDSGELLTPTSVKSFEVKAGMLSHYFDAELLELQRSDANGNGVKVKARTMFTTEILDILLDGEEYSQPHISVTVEAFNELTQESVDYIHSIDAYVLGAVYREPLKQILVKHIK